MQLPKTAAHIFEPVPIASIEPDDGGFLVRFQNCKHAVWWAIRPPRGQVVCSKCIDEFLAKAKAAERGEA